MTRARAAAGSVSFFVVVPGTVAGVLPWVITGWRAALVLPFALRLVAIAIIAAGASALVHGFVRFVVEGAGTPAPLAPTEQLVIGGLYARVRNPMYVAVLAIIFGQALLLVQPALLAYGLAVLVAVVAFVRLYEEPTLERRYGAYYADYRRRVPGWLPRLR